MWVGDSVGWDVDICDINGVDIADGIIFGLEDESKYGSSYYSFDILNDGKPVGLLLNKLLG